MKALTLIISLLTTPFSTAAEAWWLEMDKTFHDALIKRFSEGDPEACRQLSDRLPVLIKEGEIKELEWVTSDSKTGGRHFPAGEVEIKFPDGKLFPLKTGSSLQTRTKPDVFRFEIKMPGGDAGRTLLVHSHAPIAKQWQPVFTMESGGRFRVLLGRDASAVEDFWKPLGLFSVSAPVPEQTKLLWVLCKSHPLLASAVAPQARKNIFANFREDTGRFLKPSDNLRNFGTRLECETNPDHGCFIMFETLLEKKGSSNIGEVYTATGSGRIEPMGSLIKFPVNTYLEKINGKGEAENLNGKIFGEAVATLTILPNAR